MSSYMLSMPLTVDAMRTMLLLCLLGMLLLAVQFLRPMRARWNRHGLGHIDARGQLLEVESPAFPVTAIKRAEDGDGVIVRLYNIFDTEAGTTVDLRPVSGPVQMTNLNEEPRADIPRLRGGVAVSGRPNEIVTLRWRRED